MKNNLKNHRLKIINFIKYGYPVAIFTIIALLIFLMFFLYENVYQTIAQTKILAQLKQEVPEEPLKKDSFFKILENIEQKIKRQKFNPQTIKNPFSAVKTEVDDL